MVCSSLIKNIIEDGQVILFFLAFINHASTNSVFYLIIVHVCDVDRIKSVS